MVTTNLQLHVFDVPVTGQASTPSLSGDEQKTIINELGLIIPPEGKSIGGMDFSSVIEQAKKTLKTIIADAFSVNKEAVWKLFQPYKLPMDGVYHPVICIEYGNINWVKEIGGGLVLVSKPSYRPADVLYGIPKKKFIVKPRTPWSVEDKST